MPSGLLIGLVFIPSMLFVYVILTTFYGVNRAYIAISWVPLVFILTIWLFTLIASFQHLSDQWWLDLARTIRWATLVQVALGIGLVVRALRQRKAAIAVALATLLSASPLFLRPAP
jgi:O-antigen ligase